LLVTSNGSRPDEDVLALARERGTSVVVSPLDSYVSARMIQLAVPSGSVMNRDPLVVTPEAVVSEVTRHILEIEYRAAVLADDDGPRPARRRVPGGAARGRSAILRHRDVRGLLRRLRPVGGGHRTPRREGVPARIRRHARRRPGRDRRPRAAGAHRRAARR